MTDAPDHQLKRLDHLQAIIQRVAGNSFLIKGWAITLSTAILGLSLSNPQQTTLLAFVGAVPIFLFWFLDAYYLSIERAARAMYNRDSDAVADWLAAKGDDRPTLIQGAITISVQPSLWLRAAWSPSVWTLYTLLIIGSWIVGSGLYAHIVKSATVWI